MRRGISLLVTLCLCMGLWLPKVRADNEAGLAISARAAILMDAGTGQPLFGHRQDVRMPIASVTKIMTLILIFEAVEDGKISLDDSLTVSQTAADMGGSQVYLEAGDSHRIDELVKSIIVASANDACVAMAEHLSGSEAVFVQDMNDRAKELGAVNTQFANCTGLPAGDAGSCAYDVAILSRELLRHEAYFDYSSIWMDTVEHSGGRITQISNTNKLLRSYNGADGVKTGFTNEAMHCLSATAERDGTRFIAVILGGQSSASRFEEAAMLLDYGFAHYETVEVYRAGETVAQAVPVTGSPVQSVPIEAAQDLCLLVERGQSGEVSVNTLVPETLQAPVVKGDTVGSVQVMLEGEVIGEIDVIASADAPRATFLDHWLTLWRLWVPQTCN